MTEGDAQHSPDPLSAEPASTDLVEAQRVKDRENHLFSSSLSMGFRSWTVSRNAWSFNHNGKAFFVLIVLFDR